MTGDGRDTLSELVVVGLLAVTVPLWLLALVLAAPYGGSRVAGRLCGRLWARLRGDA